jgi:putative spermidine/putrescine transport system ATP-binding protein
LLAITPVRSEISIHCDQPVASHAAAFKGVAKSYDGRVLAVDDLNLAIKRGEFLTLLGPSGSGKTTSLMMLAGFEAPSAGLIEIDGRPVTHLPPYRRNLGIVFQSYALFPHMSVAENVAFSLAVRGTTPMEIERRVESALAMVQLAGFGERRPIQLSGGQQQRVALARALVFRPKIVLMDEPLGALDRQLREHMQFELKRIHAELGVTIVYVTHDQDEALTMSDRVAIFDRGVVHQLASPRDIYDSPADAFVARFVGENNLLQGRVGTLLGRDCSIRLGNGALVQAKASPSLRADERVLLSLRPEHINVDPGALRLDAKRGSENRVSGELRQTIFRGDHVRLEVSVPQVGLLTIKAARRDVVNLRPDTATITVCWSPENCLALSFDPTTGTEDAGS